MEKFVKIFKAFSRNCLINGIKSNKKLKFKRKLKIVKKNTIFF